MQIKALIPHLEKDFKELKFFCCDADTQDPVVKYANVTGLPTVVFYTDSSEVGRVAGANPQTLLKHLSDFRGGKMAPPKVATTSGSDERLQKRLKALTTASPIMLFIKGTRAAPYCRFSKATMALMSKYNVEFGTFDVFSDDSVREGLKKFSDWPTFPQLYVDSVFVGGYDIMKEMDEDGSLKELFSKHSKEEPLNDRLRKLVVQSPVMLFMKGTPEQPQCKFSVRTVKLLKDCEIEYGSFNILTDDAVRQGLKTLFDWPTFPQLYSNGKLVGGLDVMEELFGSGGAEAHFSI